MATSKTLAVLLPLLFALILLIAAVVVFYCFCTNPRALVRSWPADVEKGEAGGGGEDGGGGGEEGGGGDEGGAGGGGEEEGGPGEEVIEVVEVLE
ncbi:MAG: hypothetical protein M1824_000903 [Vezdaea acicularis]|nr:MAG: hypothetical protein M1824_000903 [Vezdaea acicularis]